MPRTPPRPALFPYTTLFRSNQRAGAGDVAGLAMDQGSRCQGQRAAQNIDRSAVASKLKDRKSTPLNSSHQINTYAVYCFKKNESQPASDIQRAVTHGNRPVD